MIIKVRSTVKLIIDSDGIIYIFPFQVACVSVLLIFFIVPSIFSTVFST